MSEEETVAANAVASSESVSAGDVSATDSADVSATGPAEAAEADAYVPTETRTEIEVGLVRAVRFGPIMVGSAVVVGLIAIVVALFFPVAEDADYTLGQAVGFTAVIGAVAGLALGAILALVLSRFAKRRQGAAIAVHTDVR